MKALPFKSATELAKYVNDNTIVQTKIVDVWFVQGQWWLFYYI
jgi:hypothetical protein